MRILCVLHEMALDGSGVYFSNVCRGLRARGHEVEVVSGGGELVAELVEAGVSHREVLVLRGRSRAPFAQESEASAGVSALLGRALRRVGFFLLLPPSIVALGMTVARVKPDVVYVHSPGAAWLATRAAFGRKLRIVAMVGSPWGADGGNPLWARVAPRVCFALFFSKEIRNAVSQRFSGLTARSRVFAAPVDTDLFRASKPRIGGSSPTVLLVSRVDADKWPAIESAVVGFSEVAARIEGCVLEIVGGGSHEKQLRELVALVDSRLGRNAVRCLGPRRDVAELLAGASAFLGVGTCVAEALSAGVPSIVIGSASGGEPPRYGGIVNEGSVAGLAGSNFTGRGSARPVSSDVIAADLEALLLNSAENARLSEFSRAYAERNLSLAAHLDMLEDIFRQETVCLRNSG